MNQNNQLRCFRTRSVWALAVLLAGVALAQAPDPAPQKRPKAIPPPEAPKQFAEPRAATFLEKVSVFIRVGEARSTYDVDGSGMAIAILDTGLRASHVDFRGRVPAQIDFTADPDGDEATDSEGHGTNVAGIIAASGDHTGMAPGAQIIPLKVCDALGASWEDIQEALAWVLANRDRYGISVVNLSLGDPSNWRSDEEFADRVSLAHVRDQIRQLRAARVAVVVAAGNGYYRHQSNQGMAFPAICRESISVGAVYDGNWKHIEYGDGATAFRTRRDQITPFSQRLIETADNPCRTTIFAPGAPVLSSGIATDHGESLQSGTSQASPVISGVLALMQQYYRRELGVLPSVEDLERWLRGTAVAITDPSESEDEDGKSSPYDNVQHTGGRFLRIDAVNALEAVKRAVESEKRATRPQLTDEERELIKLRELVRELMR